MADLTDLQAAQTIKIVGANSSGVETNVVNADSNGNLFTTNSSNGPVTPGTVAVNSNLMGGQFNTVLPTLTNGQQSALQFDSSGRQIIAPFTNSSVIKAQLQDNSGTAITLGQTTSSASVPIVIASDQSTLPISISSGVISNINQNISLGVGTFITSPAFPTIRPLYSYIVPTGKTLKINGYSIRTAATTTFFHVYDRTTLWAFNATALSTPAFSSNLGRVLSGAGLTLLAAYKYKLVAVNCLGKTAASAEVTVTLTGSQNAVTLAWSNITGASYYEVYRTLAGGAVNSEVFCGATEKITFVDTIPDSELGSTTPPGSNTTAGSAQVSSYPTGLGANQITVDTLVTITTPTALDIVYRNMYGSRRYATSTPVGAAPGQGGVLWDNQADSVNDLRIAPATVNQNYMDTGINNILGVGNTPATGSFTIYGLMPLIYDSSTVAGSWQTKVLTEEISFPAGSELVIGTSSSAIVAIAARNDINLFGTLT